MYVVDFGIGFTVPSRYLPLQGAAANIERAWHPQLPLSFEGAQSPPDCRVVQLVKIGMSPEMSIALKHLARKISEKGNKPYPETIGLLRCRFSFEMMRAALICLRGSRSVKKYHYNTDDLNDHVSVVAKDARFAF